MMRQLTSAENASLDAFLVRTACRVKSAWIIHFGQEMEDASAMLEMVISKN